ncbi:MAG: hypothetical protein IJQ15_11585 [Synergistaceae bacterium]|nr:hypothetical protein [Synergistaceae bacterium]
MIRYEDIAPTVKQIEKLAQKLILAISVLNTRLDTQVTASTDADADYAAEVADARADIWGNAWGSLGGNVRGGQSRLMEALTKIQTLLQGEIDALTESRMDGLLNISDEAEVRRRELAREEQCRILTDESLQRQLNTLSEAVLEVLAIISENRERQTGGKD